MRSFHPYNQASYVIHHHTSNILKHKQYKNFRYDTIIPFTETTNSQLQMANLVVITRQFQLVFHHVSNLRLFLRQLNEETVEFSSNTNPQGPLEALPKPSILLRIHNFHNPSSIYTARRFRTRYHCNFGRRTRTRTRLAASQTILKVRTVVNHEYSKANRAYLKRADLRRLEEPS